MDINYMLNGKRKKPKGCMMGKVLGNMKNIDSFEAEYENGKLEMDIEFKGKKKSKELIKGGYGDFIPDKAFNKKQLRMGMKTEMEHTKSKRIAKEISKDHLSEIPDYYTRLNKMEKRAKKR